MAAMRVLMFGAAAWHLAAARFPTSNQQLMEGMQLSNNALNK